MPFCSIILFIIANSTVSENIIVAPKMGNNYGAIFNFFNIATTKLNFFLLLLVQLSLFIFCFIFGIISLLLSFFPFSTYSYRFFLYFSLSPLRLKKSDEYRYHDSWKSNNYKESNTKKHESIYKTAIKMKQRG